METIARPETSDDRIVLRNFPNRSQAMNSTAAKAKVMP